MPNSFFQFKQFRVNQDRCGMKVTTDACLFGALAANLFQDQPAQILDIGAGTGLLSLMMAQSNPQAKIDAVEINADAFRQCQENFAASKWGNRFRVHHTDITTFASEKKFNIIICNPPFFHKHQIGKNSNKNLALHSVGLTADKLANAIDKLLDDNGRAFVMYPEQEMIGFKEAMKSKDLNIQLEYIIKDKRTSPAIRSVCSFSRSPFNEHINEILIKENDNQYTQQFSQLLQPYYLHL